MNKKSLNISRTILLFILMGFFCILSSCASLELRNNTEIETETGIFSNHTDILQKSKENIGEENIMLNVSERHISKDAEKWVELYNKKHGEGAADEIILDSLEIKDYNRKIIENCPTVYDMTLIPEQIDGVKVREMIHKYSMPQSDKFDKHGNHIKDNTRDEILQNCNIDAVADTVGVKTGIIIKRCDLKGFPTELGFYNKNDTYYSSIQETELIVGFPVFILHESRDGEFLFVQSYYYVGWIPKNAVAYAEAEEYLNFVTCDKFITVTEPYIFADETRLCMGCTLPYVSEDEQYYYASLPYADEKGRLALKDVKLEKTQSCYGYLPYTMKNYYRQAFTYIGTLYGWGGSDGGVDCSGFVCSVFRSFGIYLPRNTGEQSKYNGESVTLTGLSAENASSVLSSVQSPASLHRKGHVMLYLGEENGRHYIIHAPKGGEKVTTAEISLPGEFTNICLIK